MCLVSLHAGLCKLFDNTSSGLKIISNSLALNQNKSKALVLFPGPNSSIVVGGILLAESFAFIVLGFVNKVHFLRIELYLFSLIIFIVGHVGGE